MQKPKHKKLKKIRRLKTKPEKVLVGWQEWCALPKLHLPAIKAKIDTGAKTSALHAWDIHTFHRHGELFVHFTLHPLQGNIRITQLCTAKVIDERVIMNSGGQKERRFVIITPVALGQRTWDIEITLTNRDPMAFRMLLGRNALKGQMIVDPGKALHLGKLSKKEARFLYAQTGH
jgi:ribosomal protein S6--L-glutamate ligase